MSLDGIKALTFDTGGTILDWHTGFKTGLEELGVRHGVNADWTMLANEIRKGSLGRMLNLGEEEPPAYNFDGAHRAAVDEVHAGVLAHAVGYARPLQILVMSDSADFTAMYMKRHNGGDYKVITREPSFRPPPGQGVFIQASWGLSSPAPSPRR